MSTAMIVVAPATSAPLIALKSNATGADHDDRVASLHACRGLMTMPAPVTTPHPSSAACGKPPPGTPTSWFSCTSACSANPARPKVCPIGVRSHQARRLTAVRSVAAGLRHWYVRLRGSVRRAAVPHEAPDNGVANGELRDLGADGGNNASKLVAVHGRNWVADVVFHDGEVGAAEPRRARRR